jgi:AcrR family transcriptional regulator
MRTADGWVISMPKTLAEDLAWSLVWLAGEDGLGAITMRSLARHARLSPGTITNHFGSKQELWAVCTTVIGRWLAEATSDHVEDRGPVGLFPTQEDLTYRLLVSAWAQLRAHALSDPEVDQRVQAVTTLLRSSARHACVEPGGELPAATWWCLEGLRQELVRPGTELTAAEAWGVLRQAGRSARREPPATEPDPV